MIFCFTEESMDDVDGYFEDEYAPNDGELYVSLCVEVVDTLSDFEC